MKTKKILEVNKDNIESKSILNALFHLEGKPALYHFSRSDIANETKKPIIKIEKLKKEFGKGEHKKEVLKNINLNINKSENVALMGGNGAGKTTLVEIVAGLNKPTSGNVEYLYEFNKNFQENLGIQFQDSSYPPAITVKEVLDFMTNIYDCQLNIDEFNALIKIFGIDEYYKKRASKLSGGQQQRLNVLLALLHKPKIIFLDELSTGLDISIRTRIKKFIYDYAIENDITIVLVSHDMGEIEQLCEQIVFLKDGEIIYNKSLKETLAQYETLEKFTSKMLD